MPPNADIEAVLTAIAARNGLPLPEDRKTAIFNGFLEVDAMCARLRSEKLTATDEPSNIYGFDPITRIA